MGGRLPGNAGNRRTGGIGMGRTITVDPVTRLEGHAKIVLDLDDGGKIVKGHLQVLEIRGFEKLVEKMELFKMPQIIARICGVCPAAQHLASVIAIENGLGISPPEEARLLRELMYMGHLLHSHALSTFLLAGPDLLVGFNAKPENRSIFGILSLDAELAKKVLRLRSIGQRTVEIVGGRGVHPVSAVPGGMSARPEREKLDLIAGWSREALGILEDVSEKVRDRLAALDEFRQATILPLNSMGLSKEGVVSYLEGDAVVVSAHGETERTFSAAGYADQLIEHVLPSSHMKSVRLRSADQDGYFVGPLARLNVNNFFCTPRANEALREFHGKRLPRLSALDFIEARLLEMLFCCERMSEIADGQLSGGPIRVDAVPGEGRYRGMIESPRGVLIHDYTADAAGRVTEANLIVATQNNYDAIDSAITSVAGHFLPLKDDDLLMNGMEFALRCFDPCLACATHASGRMPMEVVIRREMEPLRTISRRHAI
jgi:F420-non-reducing hydrogenase large subunit